MYVRRYTHWWVVAHLQAQHIYTRDLKNPEKLKFFSKKFKNLKRENRPDWAQIVEKIFFKILDFSTCMFIYGVSAYFRAALIWQGVPFEPENRVLAKLIKSCIFNVCNSNFTCKYF